MIEIRPLLWGGTTVHPHQLPLRVLGGWGLWAERRSAGPARFLKFPPLIPDPEEAIYDDVPKENSDSEPGWISPAVEFRRLSATFPLHVRRPCMHGLGYIRGSQRLIDTMG